MRSYPYRFARCGGPTQSAPVSETSPTSGYPWTEFPSRTILNAGGFAAIGKAAH
jgi:hypothetical protein